MADDGVDFDETSDEEWDSGPFCPHWSDPSECERLCECDHQCRRHGWGGCSEGDCPCDAFHDPQED